MGGRKENVTLQCSLVHEIIKSLIVICKCGTISNDQQGDKCKVVDKFRLHSSLETKYLSTFWLISGVTGVKWVEVKWGEVRWGEVRWSGVKWGDVGWDGVAVWWQEERGEAEEYLYDPDDFD